MSELEQPDEVPREVKLAATFLNAEGELEQMQDRLWEHCEVKLNHAERALSLLRYAHPELEATEEQLEVVRKTVEQHQRFLED